ncbi:unnamed protein product [Durusdinium trenchii]|uniref:UBX domain-containing protein n=1 Tax=Durusdinium trenchii TaxID=1381693 RepID=A0ABP0Q768_9DINO
MHHLQHLGQSMARAWDEAQQAAQRAEALRHCEAEERPCWSALYESRYQTPCAPGLVFEGSFAEAHAQAREKKQLLLLWLESSEVQQCGNTTSLDREALAGEVFNALVKEYFVLWPGDADRWLLPVQLKEMLRLRTPCFAVLEPLSVFEVEVFPWSDARESANEFPINCAWSFLGALEGAELTEGALMSFLAQHGDAATARRARREAAREEQRRRSAEARRLREEQDRDYEESLRRDQERGERNEAKLDPALARLRATRQEHAQQLMRLPRTVQKDACHLVLRFPCGRRAERSFAATQTLSELYRWADCAGELAALEKTGDRFDVPEKFTLATSYPKAVLKDRSKTLRQLHLTPSAVLTLCPES